MQEKIQCSLDKFASGFKQIKRLRAYKNLIFFVLLWCTYIYICLSLGLALYILQLLNTEKGSFGWLLRPIIDMG